MAQNLSTDADEVVVLADRAIARLANRPSQLPNRLVLLSHSVIISLAQQLPSRQYQSNDSLTHHHK
jgi:hypothetical protein